MNNGDINLNLYKTFYDVAKFGSISLASKNLYISQPAISRNIKKLENDLNVTLFYRTLNGMVLTDKGKELFSYVEEAYNSIKIGEKSMNENTNLLSGSFSIGVPSHIATFFLMDRINKFHKDYPGIEVSLVSRPTTELVRMLDSHELDFIVDQSPIYGTEKELYIEELFNSNFVFACLNDDKYNNITSIKELKELPLILPLGKSSYRQKLDAVLKENDITFDNVISVDKSDAIREAILSGNGIGYLLKDVINKDINNGKVKLLDIKEKLPYVTINLVYIDKYLTNASQVFIDNYLRNK